MRPKRYPYQGNKKPSVLPLSTLNTIAIANQVENAICRNLPKYPT